jgi:hypothetical protein
VALSFLYRVFCRVLQLIRLCCRKGTAVAIKIVILRHEVTALRRQIHRPVLQPTDRAVLSSLWRLVARSDQEERSSPRIVVAYLDLRRETLPATLQRPAKT